MKLRAAPLSDFEKQEIVDSLQQIINIDNIDFYLDDFYSKLLASWQIDFQSGNYFFVVSGYPETFENPASLDLTIQSTVWDKDECLFATLEEQYWKIGQNEDREKAEQLTKQILEIISQKRNCLDRIAKK
jgi:hypothetical protein